MGARDGRQPMDVLVTGVSGGIGRAVSELFLERGHRVDGLDVVPATVEHARYRHHIADVRDAASLPDLSPQVIVTCAGVQNTPDDIDVNLKGAINVCERYAFQSVSRPRERVRSVVNVGSSSGHNGSEFPHYAASKGGIIAYTKNLALRLAPQAIANSVDPGGVLTDLNRPVMDDPGALGQDHGAHAAAPLGHPARDRGVGVLRGRDQPIHDGAEPPRRRGEAGNAQFVWPDVEVGHKPTE